MMKLEILYLRLYIIAILLDNEILGLIQAHFPPPLTLSSFLAVWSSSWTYSSSFSKSVSLNKS